MIAPIKTFSVMDPDGTLHQMTWANASDLVRNANWKFQEKTIIHAKPEGVLEAKTPEGKAKQETIVEVPQPASLDDPYLGVAKDVLQNALVNAGVEIDRRWNTAKLIGMLEETLDQRLTESGDVIGLEDKTPSVKSDRSMRAYTLEIERVGKKAAGLKTIKALVESLAAI
jgi:hypothetical protein